MVKNKSWLKRIKAGAKRAARNVEAFNRSSTVKGLRSWSANVLAGFDEDFYPKKRRRR